MRKSIALNDCLVFISGIGTAVFPVASVPLILTTGNDDKKDI